MCHTIFAVASNLRAIAPPSPLPLRSLPNFLIPFSFSSFVPFISSFHFDGHYYMTNHDLISFANIFLLSSLRNVPFPQSQCYTVPQVYGKIYQFYHRRIRNRCRHTNTHIYTWTEFALQILCGVSMLKVYKTLCTSQKQTHNPKSMERVESFGPLRVFNSHLT